MANYATLCNTVSTQYNIALSEKRSPKPPSLRGHQLDQSKGGRLDILGADINPSLLIHFHLLVKSGTLCLKKCGFTIYVQTPLSLPEGPSVLEGELGYFEGRQPSPTLPSSTFTRTHCLLLCRTSFCSYFLKVHIYRAFHTKVHLEFFSSFLSCKYKCKCKCWQHCLSDYLYDCNPTLSVLLISIDCVMWDTGTVP